MSVCLTIKDGVKARKRHHCSFCFEGINPGDLYDKRTGVSDGDMFTMHMHPECHAYEKTALTADDYEDMSDPVFERKDAQAFVAKASPAAPQLKEGPAA